MHFKEKKNVQNHLRLRRAPKLEQVLAKGTNLSKERMCQSELVLGSE